MTISIERLNILRQTFKATAKTSEALESAALNDAATAISELLAVRDAQSVPVGFRSRLGEHGTWHFNGWRDPDAAEKEHCQIEMLYTAPPAPAVPAAYRYRYNGKHLASAGCGDMVSSWKYCEEVGLVNPDERYECQALFATPTGTAAPADYQHLKRVSESYFAVEKRLFDLAQRLKGPSFDHYAYSLHQAIDVLDKEIFGEGEDNGAMLAAAPTPTKAGE